MTSLIVVRAEQRLSSGSRSSVETCVDISNLIWVFDGPIPQSTLRSITMDQIALPWRWGDGFDD